jgi:Na+/citrate or Na+/malate symporter
MLFIAVLVKLTRAVPPTLQLAGQTVYEFFPTAVTYPLLFAIGVSMTPSDKLVAAITPARANHYAGGSPCRSGDLRLS